VIYAAEGMVYRSADSGATWTRIVGPAFTAVTLDSAHPGTIYVGGDRIARSVDNGKTWQTTFSAQDEITELAVIPGKPSVVLAASGSQLLRSDFRTLHNLDLQTGQILRSRDGGTSWQIAHPPSAHFDYFGPLAVDATDPDTLYTGSLQAGVLCSRDGGATLKPIGALLVPSRQPIGFLATFRNQPGIVYATVFDGGLYRGEFEW
jgi:hypothetical protein